MEKLRDHLHAALADRYAIENEIGAGGMATVYAAADLKHHRRRVAIKVLRPELSESLGADRFLKEIEVTANLQHPNILPLFDSGRIEVGEARQALAYYVTPLVEGGSLRQRLDQQHQLGVTDAVDMARAIAGALHYAHSHHIIHRDIKPENILLQSDQPLIADFGIALAVQHAAGSRVTQTGLLIGSPTYMSPEQAAGERELDARTDIYTLGCVLYEMLVGRPPRGGPDLFGFGAAVTSPIALRPSIPPHVEAATLVALELNPADRFSSAADFARALGDPSFRRPGTDAIGAASRRWRFVAMAGWAAAIVLAAIAASTALRRGNGEAAVVSFQIPPTPNVSFGEFNADPYPAVSPDGRSIAFIANTPANKNQLFVRQIAAAEPVALEQIVNAQWPFWSHDGRHIGYFADGKLRRVPVDGGPAVDIATLAGFGGSWNARGDILVGTDAGIMRVPAEGGAAERLTMLDSAKGDRSHRYPQFLPDGRGFVFLAIGSSAERAGIMRATLGESDTRRLLPDVGNAVVATNDVLLFVRGASLMAQRFDKGWKTASGDPVQIGDGLQVPSGTILYSPFAAAGGTLVYRGARQPPTQLAIVNRSGVTVSTLGLTGSFIAPAWSPDGLRLVVSRWDRNSGGLNLWNIDLDRDAATPVTTGRWFNSHPVWSADSRRLFFSSTRSGQFRVHEALLATGGDSVVLGRAGVRIIPHSLSRDGRSLFYTVEDGTGPEGDIWIRSFDAGIDQVLVQSDADESQARVSPDGKFIAYCSDASGHWEVYLRPIDGTSMSIRVSPRGGTNPAWRADGKELYYLEPDERTRTAAAVSGWVVAATLTAAGDRLVAEPRRLFQGRWSNFLLNELWVFQPDARGERFVINTVVDDAPSALTVMVGWPSVLEQRRAARP